MNKLNLSILGQSVSFDSETAFTQNYPLLGTNLIVHTDSQDPRLMISIGGRRPKPTKPGTGHHGGPIVITSDADAPAPAGIKVVEIALAGQPVDIQQHPDEQMVYISIGGHRPGGAGTPLAPLALQFDTSGGQWQFQQDAASGQFIARVAVDPPQNV